MVILIDQNYFGIDDVIFHGNLIIFTAKIYLHVHFRSMLPPGMEEILKTAGLPGSFMPLATPAEPHPPPAG